MRSNNTRVKYLAKKIQVDYQTLMSKVLKVDQTTKSFDKVNTYTERRAWTHIPNGRRVDGFVVTEVMFSKNISNLTSL